MRIVVAIGGNALLQRGQPMEIDTQRLNVKMACAAIAKIAECHEVIVTHGNGPQIGLLALQAAAYENVAIYPLDVLGAESQGMIGYLLAQALKNQLPYKKIAVLLTNVEVDRKDPAFLKPTKFVGPCYNKKQSDQLAEKYHWEFLKEGSRFRRVVPSPLPQNILEIDTIRSLINANTIVVCGGGGGVPLIHSAQGYCGVEAVIDKDFSSALLAEQLRAQRLLFLTDVAHVCKNWGESDAAPLKTIHCEALEQFTFAHGSMGPKVSAACQFVKNTRAIAHIGLLSDAQNILQQVSGTTILP